MVLPAFGRDLEPGTFPRWRWVFRVAIALLLLSGVVAIHQHFRSSAALSRVGHTHQTIVTIDGLLARLFEVETRALGFLLTGNASFLAPYQEAEPGVVTTASALVALAQDDPRQLEHARRLLELSRERTSELRLAVEEFKAGRPSAARARISSGTGRRLMDQIRARAADMKAAETSLQEQRASEALVARRTSFGFGIASLLLAAALGLLTASVDRTFERRRDAFDREARRLQAESERSARADAERATQMKDEFLSTLSHELRTPLNSIVGWISVLKHDQSRDTLRKAIDVIDRNSRRQAQMIDDLLDVSRIVSGKLRLELKRVDMASVIEEAVTSAQPAAQARGVRVTTTFDTPTYVIGDAVRLQQVVWNLVSNAIKFTPREGAVRVSLHQKDGQARVDVIDSGQGIGPDLLPDIFQRFRQGDSSSTRMHDGLGLGLAIVKNLVEMHGGSVVASSGGPGLGSAFSAMLPLAPPSGGVEPELTHAAGQSAALLSGVLVLVVDDEADARDVAQRLLEDAGARVVACDTAHAALQRMQRGLLPDVIVSDVAMPEQDGYDFMKRVRQLESPLSSVPAAALTALARVTDRRRAVLAGFQTHLTKPVDPHELVATVASLAGRARKSYA